MMDRIRIRLTNCLVAASLLLVIALPASAGTLHKVWVVIKAPYTMVKDMILGAGIGIGMGVVDVMYHYEK